MPADCIMLPVTLKLTPFHLLYLSLDLNFIISTYFVCGLFNDIVSSPDYVAYNYRLTSEWERVGKGLVVA
jgi:hypothetical protein